MRAAAVHQEKTMVDIAVPARAAGTDLALKELYEDMAARHQQHCQLLQGQLKKNGDSR